MLERLTLGERNEALAGDLHEEFSDGRSADWYWRQVLTALAMACTREFASHRIALLFAALWAMLAPAWLLMLSNIEQHSIFTARIVQLDWPWPILCDLGLLLGANVLFIWLGISLYLILHLLMNRSLQARPLSHGIRASLPVLLAVWAALIVLPKIFLLAGQPAEQRSLTPHIAAPVKARAPVELFQISPYTDVARQNVDVAADPKDAQSAIADLRVPAIVVRLPFFLCVLCTLWGATPRAKRRSTKIHT
jgi:hypothetical protein